MQRLRRETAGARGGWNKGATMPGIFAKRRPHRQATGPLALIALAVAISALLIAPPAHAQFSDSYSFLKAVRDRDGTEASKFLNDQSSRVINTRDVSSGETALAIVVQRRDLPWTRFLLARGADPALADRAGTTPLMRATLLGFTEGAEVLLDRGAAVDQTNRRGETALMLAVQSKNAAIVRLLVAKGANPDRTDHVAGLSARDYARRDDRTGALLALLDAKADAAPELRPEATLGPKL